MMAEAQTPDKQERKDFLISYAGSDRTWAEWIAATLEEGGYQTHLAAWDVRPGANVVLAMDEATRRAERTLLVLSSAYLADATVSEWTVAFGRDPQGRDGRVVPVRIDRCAVEGLLSSLVCVDLVDLPEQEARECLLAGVNRERAKPATVPFPALSSSSVSLDRAIFPPSLPPIWNVPYPQNALFTGREELLTQLERTLHAGQPTALSQPRAISGLGGVGKTQLALEYVYLHRHDYQAVLWAQADTREALTSSYLSIASLLDLSGKDAPESARVIAAVKEWLQSHTNWLLILDNADELALARDFLPPSVSGQVLLTTRAQAMGRFGRRLEVDVLPTEVGSLFLLRRAGLLALEAPFEQAEDEQQEQACALCEELGGLPLALDQAGAYIEETGSSLLEYQRLFERRRADLLARRGGVVEDHPLPVAATWSLSFEKVEQKHPVAADLLRVCAFLAPDAIPEEIITEGAVALGPRLALLCADPLLFSESIAALRAYSLLRRDPANYQLHVHRLVQVVLRDALAQEIQQQWAERVVMAVTTVFPYAEDVVFWPRCDRCLPHARVCADWITRWGMVSQEAGALLNKLGRYLDERGQYPQAESFLTAALVLRQQKAREHPDHAQSLNNLALLFWKQGKYQQAEPLYLQALSIWKNTQGEEHMEVARVLSNLALLYATQGKYVQAKAYYQQALSIWMKERGGNPLEAARVLNNLGGLSHDLRQYAQAEAYYPQALLIWTPMFGAEHPDVLSGMNNLAGVYLEQGKGAEAEPLYKWVLQERQRLFGPNHPHVAQSLNNLGCLSRRSLCSRSRSACVGNT